MVNLVTDFGDRLESDIKISKTEAGRSTATAE